MAVNKAILIGNVGKDPEIRYLDNNVAVANFSIATTERGYTTRNGQTIPERTEWHNIVAWRGLAEVVEKYVKKGTQIYIEGKIRTRTWDDKDGIKRYTTEIYADNMQLLGRRGDAQGTQNTTAQSTTTPNSFQGDPLLPSQPPTPNQSTEDILGGGDETDDLPF